MLYILLLGLIGLQFMSGDRPEVREDNPGDLMKVAEVSDEVASILKTSCYDCHSMETNYPWYTRITPVNGVIYHHIEEGREELNFSEWQTLPDRKKIRKLKEIAEEVEEEKMPLASYTLIHGGSDLSPDQIKILSDWAEQYSNQLLGEN